MSADDIEIRRLAQQDPADPVLYQSVRLEALQANPEAFGSAFEVEKEKPVSWFSDRGGYSARRVPQRSADRCCGLRRPAGSETSAQRRTLGHVRSTFGEERRGRSPTRRSDM
jgi:hypothetical protein